MDMEMRTMTTNGNNGTTCLSNERVTADNGHSQTHKSPEVAETDSLLHVQINGTNVAPKHQEHKHTPSEHSSFKKKLNEVIFWKVRLWMVYIFICLLIAAVIVVSLFLCAVIHNDADENFDRTSFNVPRYFNGSFRLPAHTFTEELLTISSNESRALAAELQKKIANPYRSSPALERFFSEAVISAFWNGSVIAEYRLSFVMPEEQQDELRRFTLSREMVYNVFRQFLFDQETDESEPMYIDPVSLKMF